MGNLNPPVRCDPSLAYPPLGWRGSFGQVFRMSASIVPATLAQMAIGFLDTWMVSQMGVRHIRLWGLTLPLDTLADPQAGKAALAAVTPAVFAFVILMTLFVGTAGAVSTFASQALGRDEKTEAGQYAWQSVYLAVLSIVAVAGAVLAAGPIFRYYTPDPQVRANELAYFDIRSWSLPAVVVLTGLSGFFQGIHRPLIPALVGIASNGLNLLLNWMLIYGHWGAARMGIAGAAAASAVSTVTAMLVLFALFLAPQWADAFGTRRGWRPSARRLRRLVAIGLPGGLGWLLDMIGWSLLTIVLVPALGQNAQAASNAVMNYLQLGFMPVVGVGIAVMALVGKAVGQRRPDHAGRFAAAGFCVGGCYQLAVGVLMIVFRVELMRFFSDDPTVIALGSYALVCAGVFQFFDAMGIVYTSALRGAGDMLFIFAAYLVLIFGLFVPLSLALTRWVMPARWGELLTIGPWIAGTVYVIVLGLAVYARWRSRRWQRIDIFK